MKQELLLLNPGWGNFVLHEVCSHPMHATRQGNCETLSAPFLTQSLSLQLQRRIQKGGMLSAGWIPLHFDSPRSIYIPLGIYDIKGSLQLAC